MRIPLKASISAALGVAALAVAAATSLAGGGPEQPPVSLEPEPGSLVHDVDGGLGPQVVVPRPGMAGVRARPFDSASVDADGVTVTIDFVSGVEPCYVLDHVDVVETSDTVTVTLFEGHDPSAGDVACIEIAVFKRTIVTLDDPIGDREIVDGAA